MRIPSRGDCRGCVSGRFTMQSIAFSMILLWITVACNKEDRLMIKIDQWSSLGDESNEDFPSFPEISNLEPTVFPGNCGDIESKFDANEYSLAELIRFLTRCTRSERRRISDHYWCRYCENLGEKVKKLIPHRSENDEDLRFTQMSGNLTQLLASKLRDATEVWALNYDLLRLILTPLSDTGLGEISAMYKFWFDEEPEEVLRRKSREDPELWVIMERQLKGPAIKNDKMTGNKISHETTGYPRLIRQLLKNRAKIRQIVEYYDNENVDDALNSFDETFSSNAMLAFVDILDFAENPHHWFAKKLHTAMSTAKTDFPTIIFIISWRAEIDLGNVKTAYEILYGVRLYDVISKVARNDDFLRDVLLGIIGDP